MPSSDGWKNLRPQPFKKGEQRTRDAARKGGAANGKKKNYIDLAAAMLSTPATGGTAESIRRAFVGLGDEDLTTMAAVLAGQIQSAAKGNSRAFETLLQLQREHDEHERQRQELNLRAYHLDLDAIGDNFHAFIRDIRNHQHLEYVEEGGRGSLKSTTYGMIIPELMKNHPDAHALVVRKVSNTCKDSVYAQIKWELRKQGIEEQFEATRNPLEITLKATGQKIYFRGADDPEKIKSIKPEFGYIAILWFEELDQFDGEEEVRNITESAIRGGDIAWIFKSFNPPKSANNWANKYIKIPKENRLVHHSVYTDVPPEWLGAAFLEEAEHLREVNPEAYEHEYLGVANAAGGAVFTQLELREISDDEIKRFDHIYQGIDWGLAPDPFAFVRIHYDRTRETVYFIDEYVVRGARNVQTAEALLARGYNDFVVTCDSAEKKSTLDYKDMGFSAVNARKGPGSVEYGMKWLAGRRIVIDPKRTPVAAEEFAGYEFDRDREGNLVTGYPDRDNHTIDATRYALEKYCNSRYNNA